MTNIKFFPFKKIIDWVEKPNFFRIVIRLGGQNPLFGWKTHRPKKNLYEKKGPFCTFMQLAPPDNSNFICLNKPI